jgi:DNA repair protein RadC
MADHQVLELLLTYALPRVDVNPLAHRLLSRFGSLEGVLSARPDQLRQVEGIGESAAVFLSLLGQVDRRVLLQRFAGHDKRPVLATPSALGRYMLALSLQDRYETLRLVCLNKKYELIYEGVISSGSLTEVLADPRPILETALIHKACFIALAHNHPSGDPRPGQADLAETKALQKAARSMELTLLDHIIVCDDCYYSFTDERMVQVL